MHTPGVPARLIDQHGRASVRRITKKQGVKIFAGKSAKECESLVFQMLLALLGCGKFHFVVSVAVLACRARSNSMNSRRSILGMPDPTHDPRMSATWMAP